MILWVKALHLIFMVAWFAGLFYLPRLFVYHATAEDRISIERFKVMERKLFFIIMTPGGILTILFGLWTMVLSGYASYAHSGWLQAKLVLVLFLVAYHVYCGRLVLDFKHERNRRSHIWYRWFNEIPTLMLFAIIVLAVVKPF